MSDNTTNPIHLSANSKEVFFENGMGEKKEVTIEFIQEQCGILSSPDNSDWSPEDEVGASVIVPLAIDGVIRFRLTIEKIEPEATKEP